MHSRTLLFMFIKYCKFCNTCQKRGKGKLEKDIYMCSFEKEDGFCITICKEKYKIE